MKKIKLKKKLNQTNSKTNHNAAPHVCIRKKYASIQDREGDDVHD